MPIAIAAHNDRKIRMYDMRAGNVSIDGFTALEARTTDINHSSHTFTDCTGECIGSLTAHQDSVATLSIDSSGLYLASGGKSQNESCYAAAVAVIGGPRC